MKKKKLNEGMVFISSLLPINNPLPKRKKDNFTFKGFPGQFDKNGKRIINEFFHEKDDLLRAITFEDVIIALQSNESIIDEASAKKVWKELLKAAVDDAEYEFRNNIKQIINLSK